MRNINLRLLHLAFKNENGHDRPIAGLASKLADDDISKDYLDWLEERVSLNLARKAMYYEIPAESLKQYFALEQQMINTIAETDNEDLMNVFVEWQEVRNKLNGMKFDFLMEFLKQQ